MNSNSINELTNVNEFVNEFTGQSDFLDGINENSVGSLDFGQIEALINGNSLQSSGIFPESPPDSGSEPYSPNYTTLQVLAPQPQPFPPDTVQSTSIEIDNNVAIDEQLHTQTYEQQYLVKNGLLSPEMASTSLGVVVAGPSMVTVSPTQQQQHSPIPGFETVAPPGRLPSIIYPHTITELATSEFVDNVLPTTTTSATTSTTLSRKRKCTDAGEQSDEFTWPRNADQDMVSQDGELTAPSVGSNDSNDAVRHQSSKHSDSEAPMQNIKFQTFQKASWSVVCDQNLKESPLPQYRVNADKGFNFSVPDDSFVCQKKNHFQVTCHAHMQGAPAPVFVTTKSGLEKILEFQLHFYGVKLEAPTQQIRIEQSQPDRTKRPYNPVKMDLRSGRPLKLSIGRLHFSETTANNMRKKGRPNPDQRYFQLVVGLHALTHSGNFPLISMASERIIVRASNPSQFDNVEVSMDTPWSTGDNGCIYHNGMVGINTDRVEESLVVNGNIKVSGQILANSDVRAKQEICELDSKQQLQNIQKIRVVRYRYEPDFAIQNGLVASGGNEQDYIDTGVIAQEIQKILPDAVRQQKGRILVNGEFIEDFLLINKDRIFMENIGAIKELCKLTGSLETRIQQLERINSRLSQRKESSLSRAPSPYKQIANKPLRLYHHQVAEMPPKYTETFDYCSNKMIQAAIVVLILVILASLSCLSTLYFVEHNGQPQPFYFMSSMRGNGVVGSMGAGSDINSIQNKFLPKMNGKYYTFAPHAPQSMNSNHKSSTSHDNQYSKSTGYDTGLTDGSDGDGVHNWKQKKNNDSKSKSMTNKNSGDLKTSVYTPIYDEDTNTLASDDSLLTRSKTVTVQEIGLTKEQLKCLADNNNIEGTISLCTDPCNSAPQLLASVNAKTTVETVDAGPGDDDDKLFVDGAAPATQTQPANQSDANVPNVVDSEPIVNDNIIKNLIIPADIEADLTLTSNQTAELLATKAMAERLTANAESPPNLSDSKDVKFEASNKNEVDGQQHNEHLPGDDIVENQHSAQYLEQKKQNVQQLVRPEIPPPVQQQNSGAQVTEDCSKVILRVKADFNLTLGVEEICMRREVNILNVTYLIPVSKYMKESEIELQFLSPKLDWVLCSSKQTKINELEIEIENGNYIDSETKFIMHDNVPTTAGLTKSIYPFMLPLEARTFEKYLIFRTIIPTTEAQDGGAKSTRNICDESPKKHLGHYLQYNIKFFRDC